jgi:SAM-dependent methyltransferase
MPDVYAMITDVEPAVVERVAEAMEVSAADPQHLQMVRSYLGDLALAGDDRVLEIGCGTGAISRELALWPGAGEVVGVDPSPILLAKARELSAGIGNVSFMEGDGRAVALPGESFDVVVLHRVLSHIPAPEEVLAESSRLLRPGGRIAVFDGDYATITLDGVGEGDDTRHFPRRRAHTREIARGQGAVQTGTDDGEGSRHTNACSHGARSPARIKPSALEPTCLARGQSGGVGVGPGDRRFVRLRDTKQWRRSAVEHFLPFDDQCPSRPRTALA